MKKKNFCNKIVASYYTDIACDREAIFGMGETRSEYDWSKLTIPHFLT